MSTFPSVLSSYTDPIASNRLNSPSHSSIESAQNSGISQLEAVIGIAGASSVVGTYEYLVKSPASNGGGHVQTANKGGTGQTTFNKGDVLVAQSSSVLSKLALGTDNYVLTADSAQATGLKWGVGYNAIPTVRVYGYSSSVITWNKPSVLSYAVIEVLGGGGGGTGVNADGEHGVGGGGGGYAKKTILASVLGTTESVVVGIAGTAGPITGAGGDGGTTGFGTSSILYATGGSAGGGGGLGYSGDINCEGGGGGPGTGGASQDVLGGNGGNSFYGGGGAGGNDGAGSNGGVYGGGGGGASTTNTDTYTGGAGAAGVVIITEY